MCNFLSNPFECIGKGFVNFATDSESTNEKMREIRREFYGLQRPDGEFFMLSEPERGTVFHEIWKATWVGSQDSYMLVAGIVVLLLGYYLSCNIAFLQMFRSAQSARVQQKQSKSQLRLGLFLVCLSYPIGVSSIGIANGFATWLMPTSEEWGHLVTHLFVGAMETFVASAFTFWAVIPLFLYALGLVVFRLLFLAQDIMLQIYLYGMPLGFGLMYSGIPIVDEIAKKIMRRFVSLVLMPIPTVIIAKVYAILFVGSAGGAIAGSTLMILPTIFVWISIIVSWKLFTKAAPIASKAITAGVGLAAAGATIGVGGSGIAAAHAFRGNFVRAGIYTTQPDFDHAPADRNEVNHE